MNLEPDLFDFTSQPKRKRWQKGYNGFSWEQRCAATPLQNKAIREGRLERPTVCSICGHTKPDDPKGAGYIFCHLEDYSRPLDILPTCKRCHSALHSRFDDPERWLAVVKANWRQEGWFRHLTMDPQSQFRAFDVTYPSPLPGPFD